VSRHDRSIAEVIRLERARRRSGIGYCIGYGIGSLRVAPIAPGGVCGTSIMTAPGGKARSKNLRNQLAQSRGSVNDRTDGLAGGIAGEAACSFAS
jgi:hypothetical protein